MHQLENIPYKTGKRISPAPFRPPIQIRFKDRPNSTRIETLSKVPSKDNCSKSSVKIETIGTLNIFINRIRESEQAVATRE